MAKTKTTITLDSAKAAEARRLTKAGSVSAVIDMALTQLVKQEQLRRDLIAYKRVPPTDAELVLADMPVVFDLDDEGVDYDLLYGRPGG